MKQITTSNYSFYNLRSNNTLYVDKTQYIWELVSCKDNTYFLSRPRRFGKSLLLSTLKAFFSNKRELFKGLAIETLAPENAWQEWPVIHLDMAQSSSFDGFDEQKRAFANYIKSVVVDYGLTPEKDELPKDLLRRLIGHLYKTTGKQVVILIDEYDKPILDALHKPYIDDTVGMMQSFYQELKSNIEKERFVFITGVSKFSHTSLFSGFNNPTDISQRVEYAAMLGYTEQEVRDNFAEYIDVAAERLKMDREALIGKLKRWYDGFRFTSDAAHVFNPVSVGKFFTEMKFKNYWFATGTPTFLVKQMKNNPFQMDEFTTMWMSPMTMDKYDATSLNPMALALQTGYLSIAEVRETDFGEYYRYDFPNEEIKQSWYDCMLNLVSMNYIQLSAGRLAIYEALCNGDIDTVMKQLKWMFAGVTKENVGEIHEGYYRNMIYMLFTALGVTVHAEEQVAGGRVDIAVEAYNQAYVFELKVSRTGSKRDVEKLLGAGVDQAVSRGYADKYKLKADTIHVVSVVFEHKNRQLVAWKVQCSV